MASFCQRLAGSGGFQSLVLYLILITAVSAGVEAVPGFADGLADVLGGIWLLSQAFFTFELAVRLLACSPHHGRFFRNGWNTFDFALVAVSFVPAVGPFALFARVLRLLSASARLRGFVDRLAGVFDEAACTGAVVAVLGYVFAIAGHALFGEVDAPRWGTLGDAAASVAYLLLLQDVPGFVEPVVAASRAGVAFFLVFYAVFATLLLGVVAAVCNPPHGGQQ